MAKNDVVFLFQVGDVVYLKSERLIHMTVEICMPPQYKTIACENSYICIWFDTWGQVQRAEFMQSSLGKADF